MLLQFWCVERQRNFPFDKQETLFFSVISGYSLEHVKFIYDDIEV